MRSVARRVLIIQKGGKVHTWCADLLAGLREIGCEAGALALRDRSWSERFESWRGGGRLWENKATLQRCAERVSDFRTDLILLLNFAGLPQAADRALRAAAGHGVPLVAWLADHLTALPSETLPNLNGVHAFDSATLEVLHDAYRGSGARLDFLPLAVNPARFPNYGKPWPSRREGLVFVGNNTAGRRAMMQQFLEAGGALTAYGPGASSGRRFWRRRRISPVGSARIYRSFQGVSNRLQAPNAVNGLNLRAYEVPASGGLGTYRQARDLALPFVPDQEIIVHQNMDHLARRSRIFRHEPVLANAMMTADFNRAMGGETYQQAPPLQSRRPAKVAILRKNRGILTWAEDLQEGFHQLGVETLILSFRPSNLSERAAQWRTGKRLIQNPATVVRVAEMLGRFAPDLVVVLNYPGLPRPLLRSLREALPNKTPIIGWLCDCIKIFERDLEPSFDGVYYFDTACLPVLAAAYGPSCAKLCFLPLAASPSRYPNLKLPASSRIPKAVFAGKCTKDRQRILTECQAMGMPLDIYGPNAGNFPKIWRNRKLTSKALASIYQKYTINLNLLQSGNTENGLNMRAFEVPCAGGASTYPMVEDLSRCFKLGHEVLSYSSPQELFEISYQTIHDPEFADSVARAGHARVMSEHTFRHRAERFLADWLSTPEL